MVYMIVFNKVHGHHFGHNRCFKVFICAFLSSKTIETGSQSMVLLPGWVPVHPKKDQKVKIEFRGIFTAEGIVFCPDFAEKIIRITKTVRLVPI